MCLKSVTYRTRAGHTCRRVPTRGPDAARAEPRDHARTWPGTSRRRPTTQIATTPSHGTAVAALRQSIEETRMASNRTVYHVVPNASADAWVVSQENGGF